jgi:hypothetical protein
MAFLKESKEEQLADATSAERRAQIMGHWRPWDDMDEEKYM